MMRHLPSECPEQPELSALITEKNNARERSRNADTLIRKT